MIKLRLPAFAFVACLLAACAATCRAADGGQQPFVVFESNRTGNWEIYRVNLDGSGEQPVSEDGAGNTDPAISPGGSWILWTRREGRSSTIEICRADGAGQTTLLSRASWPSFAGDGSLIYCETRPDGKLTIKSAPFDETTGRAGPGEAVHETAWMIAREPSHISGTPAAGRMAFWSVRPRGASILYLASGAEEQIHGGCMPRMMPDGCHMIWVKRPGQFGIVRDGAIRKEADFYIVPESEPLNHGYFPFVTPDYAWLAFAACPPDQHNHDTSNYQIFVQKFAGNRPDGRPRRLTNNTATDRNPVLWTPEGAAFAARLREAFASGPETAERLALLLTDNIPGLHGVAAQPGEEARRNDFAWRADFSRSPSDAFVLDGGARFEPGGLEIPRGGGAVSRQPLALLSGAVAQRGEFLAELSVTVPFRDGRGTGTILALAEQGGRTDFLIRQNGSMIEVFHRDTEAKTAEAHGARVAGKLPDEGFNHVVVTCSKGAIRLFINGKRAAAGKVRKEIEAWSASALLYAGRPPAGRATWQGRIHAVTLTNNALGSQSVARLYDAAKSRYGGKR